MFGSSTEKLKFRLCSDCLANYDSVKETFYDVKYAAIDIRLQQSRTKNFRIRPAQQDLALSLCAFLNRMES